MSSASTLRIVCISDTHGLHRRVKVPEGDFLIHAGDFMSSGRSLDEIIDFDEWLAEQPHPYKIVIAGNHDLLFESKAADARAALTNAVYLENSGVEIAGLRFWGCPITPVTEAWAFHVPRGFASRKYWDMIPDETDVLITHGPPFGILDKKDILSSRLGCKQLTATLMRVRPRLHVFGHIHGGYGYETRPGGTVLVNCAIQNAAYRLVNLPITVELA